MSGTVTVDVSELKDYARILRNTKATEDLKWGMEAASRHVEGKLREETPHGATGMATAAWRQDVEVRSHEVLGVVRNVEPYVDVLDRGSAAGPWRAMPPFSSETAGLGLWVKRVMGLTGPQARSVAFLIARSIRRRGFTSRYQGFADKVLKRERAFVMRFFNDVVLTRVLKRLS